jgi:Tat protein translocase TatB subunit
MFGIGMTEMIVIFVIALVVLGPKRLPELARSLGRTLAEFRRAATDLRRDFADVAEEARIEPPRVAPPSRGDVEPADAAGAGAPAQRGEAGPSPGPDRG